MKYIFEFVLITIIVFFVWNIMKRLFFNSFYRFPKPNETKKTTPEEKIKSGKHGLNWDAETVEYEEVKEGEKKKN